MNVQFLKRSGSGYPTVTTAVCRVVSDIYNVEKYCDLEIPVKGQSKSLKVVPFDSVVVVPY